MRNINKGTPEQMLQAFQDKLVELTGVAGSTSVNASSITAGEYPNIQEFQDIVNYYCGYDNMSYEEVYDHVMQDYDNESLAEDVASAVEEYWENGGYDDDDIYGASESPIATYYVSGDISILIYGIEYSVDDLVKWAWSNDPSSVQVSTIEYDEEGRPYFDAEGVTVDLGEAIKACSVEGSTYTANKSITASTDSEIDRVLDIISEQGVGHYTARPKISNYAGDRFLEVDLRSGDMSVWSYEVPLEDVEYDLSCGYTPEEIATNILTDAMSDLNGGLDAFLEDDDDLGFMYDVDACSITGSEDMDTITDIEDRGEYISALSNAINDELASNGLSSTCKAEDSSVKVIVSDGDKITEFDVPNNDLKWDWNGMQDDVQYITAEVVSEFADAIEGGQQIEASDDPTVDPDELYEWLYDHETATEDALNHFDVDRLEDIDPYELESWISDHDQLWEDYCFHFSDSSIEGSTAITANTAQTKVYDLCSDDPASSNYSFDDFVEGFVSEYLDEDEYDEDDEDYDESSYQPEEKLEGWPLFWDYLSMGDFNNNLKFDYDDIDTNVLFLTDDGQIVRTKDGRYWQACWRGDDAACWEVTEPDEIEYYDSIINGKSVESATAIESDISIEPGGEYSDDDFEDDPYEPNIDYEHYGRNSEDE